MSASTRKSPRLLQRVTSSISSATTAARAVLAAAQAAVRVVEEMLEQQAAALQADAEHKAQAELDEAAQRSGPIMQM